MSKGVPGNLDFLKHRQSRDVSKTPKSTIVSYLKGRFLSIQLLLADARLAFIG